MVVEWKNFGSAEKTELLRQPHSQKWEFPTLRLCLHRPHTPLYCPSDGAHGGRMSGSVVLRLLQFLVGLYAVVAVIHTTWLYLLLPVSRFSWPSTVSAPANGHGVDRLSRSSSSNVPEVNLDLDLAVLLDDDHWADVSTSRYASSELVQLPRSQVPARKIGHVPGYGINAETLLSKAFSESMHPTRIIPFYFKATHPVDPDDVTITTLVTSNRFRVFKQLVERYRGPISVTIHIPLPLRSSFSTLKPDHPSRTALNSLHALYASSPLFSQYVDVHLALSPFTSALSPQATTSTEGEGGRQFNVWRNAARLFARTDFVMMLDVDFAVCTDWRGFIRDSLRAASSNPIRHSVRTPRRAQTDIPDGANGTEIVQRLREGTAALVVPAFEHVKQEDGVDQRSFPGDKQVRRLIRHRTG